MNKWIINKYGFINFWLFDDEQLSTSNGNLLLNGENGSGKSVTLQSFIPLILDGNTSSNRLSTEGDMSRKIDFYILYGNKEENISYIYAEFVKEYMGKKEYITFGIGFRMRRGQASPTKWYFSLKDLRIGEDIKLYKMEKGFKFTYSKNELKKLFEKSAPDKFRIYDTREEYKTEVNNALFGFPNIEEYEETLNLILELRKPSLKDSSGFDPQFIYNILNKSLKTLPENELLNMSESFENLEKISQDLEIMKKQNESLVLIDEKYQQYNEAVLRDRLSSYFKIYNERKRVKHELENSKYELSSALNIIEKSKEKLENLEYEKNNKAKRIMELSSNKEFADIQNSYELSKKNKIILENEKEYLDAQGHKYRKLITDSERNLQAKINEKISTIKDLEDLVNKVNKYKQELSFETIINLDDFFNSDKKIDISIIEKEFRDFEKKLVELIKLIKENEKIKRKLDDIVSYKTEYEENLFENKKNYRIILKNLFEKKEKLIEDFNEINSTNKILYLSKDEIDKITELLFEDEENTKKNLIFESITKLKDKEKINLMKETYELQSNKKNIETEIERTIEDKLELEKEKDIELEIKKEFSIERKKLQFGEFSEFYKAVKFKDNINEDDRGKIEKALLDSGILGGILSKEKRYNIFDKFLISLDSKPNNLSNFLEPEKDVFDFEQIQNLLNSISINKDSDTYILANGEYKIGPISGIASPNYKAKYIGIEERKKLKQEQIKKLESKINDLKQELYSIELKIDEVSEKVDFLNIDYKNFEEIWNNSNINENVEEIKENIYKERVLKENITKWKLEEENIKKEIAKIEKTINEILIFNRFNLENYTLVEENLNNFKNYFGYLKNRYSILKNISDNITLYEENLSNHNEIYDENRKNMNKIRLELKEINEKIDSYREKLENEEYKNFKTEIEELSQRVNVEIPNLLENLKEKVIRREERITILNQKIDTYQSADTKNEEKYEIFEYLLEVELKNDFLGLNEEFESIKDKQRLRDRLNRNRRTTNDNSIADESESKNLSKDKNSYFQDLSIVLSHEERVLSNYHLNLGNFEYDYDKLYKYKIEDEIYIRNTISGTIHGKKTEFSYLLKESTDHMNATKDIFNEEERRFFEDFLFNEIGRGINKRVKESSEWVEQIDKIMNLTPTSSGKKYKLKWQAKMIDQVGGMKADFVVKILGNKYSKESGKIKKYFNDRMNLLKEENEKKGWGKSNYELIKEILDYRNWYEFNLIVIESGGKEYPLTKKRLNSYSGGEKVMAVYIPLFSALYARFVNARKDGLKIIAMDEAFSVVDDENIEKLFGILEYLDINYLLASQKLSGTYKTIQNIAIVHIENPVSKQLVTPENGYVSLIKYLWNGTVKEKDLRDATQKLF